MGNFGRMFLFAIINLFAVITVEAQDGFLTNGTIIITLISEDTIWLGADSRTSALTEKGYTVNKEGMCKIYSTNDVVYAMAGHVRYSDNSFNFIEIMESCINQQKDFEESMQLFQQKAKTEISSILTKFSKKSINNLIKTNKGSFLSVVAVSFVNGVKKIKEMKFSIESTGRNNYNVSFKQTEDSGVGSLRFVGHASNSSKFIKNNRFYFGNGRSIPGKINDLIELESSQGTITVGMPADVISIYNNGYKRIINSGLCP